MVAPLMAIGMFVAVLIIATVADFGSLITRLVIAGAASLGVLVAVSQGLRRRR